MTETHYRIWDETNKNKNKKNCQNLKAKKQNVNAQHNTQQNDKCL